MRPIDTNYLVLILSSLFYTRTSSSSVQLTNDNLNQVLEQNEVVLINFYADWCRFSQILAPIFEETSKKIATEFPDEGRVALAKVDCDKESSVAAKYHVTKYPTLKIFRHGQLVKREYRGQRSVESISNFIREQVTDPINQVEDLDSLENLDRKKRHVIGYYDSHESEEYKLYRKAASALRDDCQFHAAVGEFSAKERGTGNKIVYRAPGDKPDLVYTSHMTAFDMIKMWAQDKCVPLVREITFENAEELTEEGLPFLILFHDPDDTETPEKFRKQVAKELITEKSSINTLTADGKKFSHPLYHLGKTTNDLPILAIDSFRHMYLWPNNPKEDVDKPGLLKKFVADLHSGKLHREFHHGPDASTNTDNQVGASKGSVQVIGGADDGTHPEGDHVHVQMQQQVILTPDGTPLQVIRINQVAHKGKVDLKHVESEALKAGTDLEEVVGEVPEEVIDTIQEVQEQVQDKLDADLEEFIQSLPKNLKALPTSLLQRIPTNFREKVAEFGFSPDVLAELPNELLNDIPAAFKKGVDIEAIRKERIKAAMDGTLPPHEEHESVKSDVDHLVLHEDTKTVLVKAKETGQVEDEQDTKSPPKSMFRQLFPSEHRYTLLRKDEL